MRTRARFALLFAAVGVVVVAAGAVAIYGAVGRDAARRLPAEAEANLGSAARRALDASVPEVQRLEEAQGALIQSRALLAQARIMGRDSNVAVAIEVSVILALLVAAAALAFFLLSRLITRGLDELARGALLVQRDRTRRFARSGDRDLDAVAASLNALLDLADEQERRLGEAAKLEGWREVASFLAHQLKNPLAALRLAAENAFLALGTEHAGLALEDSLAIVAAESSRLAALISRFRDLAPAGLDHYASGGEADLARVLASCAARAQIAGARVELSAPEGGLFARADEGLVEQALWNLFANSIEAGEAVVIMARLAAEGDRATVTIEDSNRGLDPALLSRLGRDRITTKREGTGLGLMLVRRILAALGGELELYLSSAGGLGAKARLPLSKSRQPGGAMSAQSICAAARKESL